MGSEEERRTEAARAALEHPAFARLRSGPAQEQLAIASQADVSLRDPNGYTLLHWACLNGTSLEAIRLLVQRGAEVDANGFKTLQTPLQWAASRGHVLVVDLLISLGASPSRADSCGYQAVHYAAQNGQSMMTFYLVSRWGAEAIEALDLEGHAPLHWAVHNGHLETVRLLVAQRADVHRADHAGMTPLHWACYQGHYQVVQVLMQAGAALAAKDRAGKSCVEVAESSPNASASFLRGLKMHQARMQAGIVPAQGARGSFLAQAAVFLTPVVCTLAVGAVVINLSWLYLLAVPVVFLAIGRIIAPMRFWRPAMWIMGYGHAHTMIAHSVATWWLLLFPHVPLGPVPAFLIAVLCVCMFYFLYKTHVTDPGVIPPNRSLQPAQELLDALRQGKPPRQWCTTCLVFRPLRAKHDAHTDRCVARFDHYCPWVGTVVGWGNHRYFVVWLACVATGLSIWVASALYYFYSLGLLQFTSVLPSVGRIFAAQPYLMLMLPWTAIHCLWLCGLTTQHVSLISVNLTTNESMNFDKKYDYLRHPITGEKVNPFSRTVLQNWQELFHRLPPLYDYYQITHLARQGAPDSLHSFV